MSILQTIAPALQAASKIIEDPYLPEISCQVLRLNKIQRGENPGPLCARTMVMGPATSKGVGLGVIRGPLRAFVWARQNPVAAVGIGAAAVGLVWFIGYSMGKGKR